MAESFAYASDLAAIWRALTAEETARASMLLEVASRRIRAELPDVDARIAAGALDAALVGDVAVSMVRRAMIGADGEGVTQQSESAGPFSRSETYANPMGNLYLTGAERSLLGGARLRRRAFSVDLAPSVTRAGW